MRCAMPSRSRRSACSSGVSSAGGGVAASGASAGGSSGDAAYGVLMSIGGASASHSRICASATSFPMRACVFQTDRRARRASARAHTGKAEQKALTDAELCGRGAVSN